MANITKAERERREAAKQAEAVRIQQAHEWSASDRLAALCAGFVAAPASLPATHRLIEAEKIARLLLKSAKGLQ